MLQFQLSSSYSLLPGHFPPSSLWFLIVIFWSISLQQFIRTLIWICGIQISIKLCCTNDLMESWSEFHGSTKCWIKFLTLLIFVRFHASKWALRFSPVLLHCRIACALHLLFGNLMVISTFSVKFTDHWNRKCMLVFECELCRFNTTSWGQVSELDQTDDILCLRID